MGTAAQHFGTGLSAEVGDGLSTGELYADPCLAASEDETRGTIPAVIVLVVVIVGQGLSGEKKTGLVGQGMTEKPGEFSN
jgi:hypothetical protein